MVARKKVRVKSADGGLVSKTKKKKYQAPAIITLESPASSVIAQIIVGLEQSAKGQVKDLGSFIKYID